MTLALRLQDFFRFADQVSEIVTITNVFGEHIFLNQAFTRVTGYVLSDFKNIRPLGLVHPDDVSSVMDVLQKLVNGAESVTASHRLRKKDGEYLYVETLLYFLRPEGSSETSLIVGIARSPDLREVEGIYASEILEQARQLAALEERQRLARDLHDAVSQTLFSASVFAETLPILIDANPAEVVKGLNKLAALTKGALAEMRTLLVELRPGAMADIDLSTLLTYLVNSFRTRLDGDITFENQGCAKNIDTDTKVSVYRIAQEALNNVARHARATLVNVRLECTEGQVTLEIHDNGRGFDAKSVSASHLGLRIMFERAEASGVMLDIISEPGQGTMVRVVKHD
ncbi:MAG: PAS domain-containing protein [Anaerolinea sp.]|nr:PAS domain-containing protein [Anaerolinea sp.]